MEVTGRFQDGQTAQVWLVTAELVGAGEETGLLSIRDRAAGRELARWPGPSLVSVPGDRAMLRLGSTQASPAARLVVEGAEMVAELAAALPALRRQRRQHRARQVRFLAVATSALAAAIMAFVFGVPLIARQVVALVPPQWEIDLGDRVMAQVEDIFSGGGALRRCQTDAGSSANAAVAGFVDRALVDVDTPFRVQVEVVHSEISNAFALPGGRIYYFSALIEEAGNGDAFAGVLAHEIGHVVGRHGLEHAVATAGTGLLVGMMLGDVTGLSVGAIIGQALINSRFSREAESAADQFAIRTAARLEFSLAPLADLLQKIAADTAASRSLSLLASHPLSEERAALLAATPVGRGSAFTALEWEAISAMCGGAKDKRK